MSPLFSLCTTPLLSLLVLQHFAFPTFWEFELDNSLYFLMNHNKLNSSSAGVSRFGAGADGILYLVGLYLQFLFPRGWFFPPHVECDSSWEHLRSLMELKQKKQKLIKIKLQTKLLKKVECLSESKNHKLFPVNFKMLNNTNLNNIVLILQSMV